MRQSICSHLNFDKLHSALMYAHRGDGHKMDVVDLDPYGTAGPFIDAGVQCLTDGG